MPIISPTFCFIPSLVCQVAFCQNTCWYPWLAHQNHWVLAAERIDCCVHLNTHSAALAAVKRKCRPEYYNAVFKRQLHRCCCHWHCFKISLSWYHLCCSEQHTFFISNLMSSMYSAASRMEKQSVLCSQVTQPG